MLLLTTRTTRAAASLGIVNLCFFVCDLETRTVKSTTPDNSVLHQVQCLKHIGVVSDDPRVLVVGYCWH